MSIKSIVLAAAAVAITATASSAANNFDFGPRLDAAQSLDLGNVTIAANGVVEIYDYRLGTQGKLLGTKDLRAGANSDVKVHTGYIVEDDVLAVLKINGQVVETKEYDVDR